MFKLLAGILLIWVSRQTDMVINPDWGWIAQDFYLVSGIVLSPAGLDTIIYSGKKWKPKLAKKFLG